MERDDTLPLKKHATNLVFGVGNPDSEILFIGEGPGYWEDIKAEPFVGRAGEFLNQLLHLIKLSREDVYITNVVHYRPPNNRDPEAEELEAFGVYLDEIIIIIDPKMIVTLGRFSMGKFLPGVKISSIHGKAKKVEWNGRNIIVIPMYHPAAGLRSRSVKLQTLEDFKKIPGILEKFEEVASENNKKDEVGSEQMSLV